MPVLRLLNEATENGPGDEKLWPGASGDGGSFFGQFDVWGDFDGADVTLEYSPDNGTTWLPVHADVTAISAASSLNFGRARVPLRAVVAGAGASTSLNARAAS